jgi:ATP-citrate lyase beta-subunit
MPRRKLSEIRSKLMISRELELPYVGWSVVSDTDLAEQMKEMGAGPFVVKVDQGIKGRFKKGLVLLDVQSADLMSAIEQLRAKRYTSFIVEPMAKHEQPEERYFALNRDRDGLHLISSTHGGVDVESHEDALERDTITPQTDWPLIAKRTGFSEVQLKKLVSVFTDGYMVTLEINPYLVTENGLRLLDLAIEVDDAGAYFTDRWNEDDFRQAETRVLSPQERSVIELDTTSPASFTLNVMNPNGSLFLLLSGGGASIVVADEVFIKGHGKKIANYGEYSGNPTSEETYIYTVALLELLVASSSPKKVLFIGGAVANFTDIANTFAGIIKAIDHMAEELKSQNLKVFVRRGGPRQEIGLARIKESLDAHGLLGGIYGSEVALIDAVDTTIEESGI